MTQVRPGERLADRYEVLSEIGRGGMGAVFEAQDTVLERRVAVKVLEGSGDGGFGNARSGSHLEYEAKLAARLDHPAIVPVYDFGRDGDRLFFVMPVVEGITLRRMLTDGPLPQVVAVVIARQVAEALVHSHARQVVHRDIKPENVMVGPGTDGPRVKVLDFGIAVSAAEAVEATPRQILGTLDYLSPEQARGEPLDGRADVYSLGAVLYECCSGKPPFVADNVLSLVEMIVHHPPRPLSECAPGVEPALEELIHRCLAKDPGERPASAEKLVEELSSLTTRLRPLTPASASVRPVMARHSTLPAAPRILGRDREIERVRSRFELAARGECQLVVVGGAYGVGKSSFASVLCETSQEWGMNVLRGRATEDDGTPYGPIGDALASFLRPGGGLQDRFAEDPKLVPLLVGLFPRLEGLLRPRAGAGSVRTLANRAERFEVIARAFGAIASTEPALLVLEDVHATASSVEAIRYLFRRLAASPLAIVLTHRTEDVGLEHPLFELRSSLLGEPAFADLELRPLDRLSSDRLAATLLPGAKLDPALRDKLYASTGGNPLHLCELTAALREGGTVRMEQGAWRFVSVAGAEESAAIPMSMRAVIGKRLQQLPPAERAILEAAAIFGRSFAFEDAAALGGPGTAEMLERLVHRGLVSRDDVSPERYLFPAFLTAESVCEALGQQGRRELHRRFAAHLVASRRTTGPDAARIAHHLVHAGERARALPYAALAARHALESGIPEAVLRLSQTLGKVLEGAGDTTVVPAAVEFDLLLARAQARMQAVPEARELVAQVLRLLEGRRPHRSTELETLEIDAHKLAAELAWEARDRETARELRRKARALAAALGRDEAAPPDDEESADETTGADANEGALVGERLLMQGAYLAARDMLARADVVRAEGTESAADIVRHALRGALLAQRLGSYDEAETIARGARQRVPSGPLTGEVDAAIAEIKCSRGHFELAWSVVLGAMNKLGATPADLHTRALLLRAKGEVAMGLGRPGEAIDAFDEAGRLLDPLTEPFAHAAAIFGSGDARIETGACDAAVPFFERAERQRLAIGDRWGLSRVHDAHARACVYRGRLRDAISHGERAVVLAAAVADPQLTAMTRTRLGLVRLECGDVKAAESALDLALRDAQGCGAEREIASALGGLAEVHLERGDRSRALEVAEESTRRASRLGLSSVELTSLLVIARARGASGSAEALARAARLASLIGNRFTTLDVEICRASVELDSTALEDVLRRATAMPGPLHVARTLLAMARVWTARGAVDRATPLFLQAGADFAELGAAKRAEEALAQLA